MCSQVIVNELRAAEVRIVIDLDFIGRCPCDITPGERGGCLGFSIDAEHLENMLNHVRRIRNTLAHFRGEITKAQREQLRFCAGWFQRNPPRIPKATAPTEPTKTIQVDELVSHFPTDEELGPNSSRYARLALFLQDRPIDEKRLRITFDEIEKIIGGELPPSARQHRSWWANDSVSHVQSIQWLEAGWRVVSMNFTEGAVTFARVKEREKSYIEFFNQLISDLRQTNAFPIRDISPNGVSWVNLVYIPRNNNGQLTCLAYSFAQGRRFRLELYIELYDQEKNKLVFDQIYSQRDAIEAEIGEALTWEPCVP